MDMETINLIYADNKNQQNSDLAFSLTVHIVLAFLAGHLR